MIKKILPTMIGVALAGGMTAAAADVSVFGHIDESVLYHDASPNGVGQDDSDTNLVCTTCSIGFKGSEDLGNGLKAIFSIDFQYDINNVGYGTSSTYFTPSGASTTITGATNNTIIDRDQWVGLAGGFGQVRIGTISTGYKSHGAMIDPLYRTVLQGRDRGLQSRYHSGAGEELEGRATNTIRWDSVDYSGIKLVAHYTLDSNKNDNEDNNPYGIGASYENGGMLVFADYMSNDQSGIGDRDAWKLGGKYDMGMFSVMGQYEDFQTSSTNKEKVWEVAGTVSLLGITAYLGLGKGEEDSSNNDYTAWTLAAMYNFSKNTMIYGGFSQYDCNIGGSIARLSICKAVGFSGGEYDLTAFGLKHKF